MDDIAQFDFPTDSPKIKKKLRGWESFLMHFLNR